MKKMKDKLKRFWRWLRREVLNRKMIVWILIAEAIFWSPCIVAGTLALIISPWYWSIVGGIMVFWAGPFTPAVPLQLGLAVGLRKLHEFIVRKRKPP